ncbi:protein PRRC2C isoform X2 [Anthonomus grandis grandis]|uniref:protein PRRC2C isoform X2 n=1 Tax=Anthonomus grandis grandis TaxID=2921223 RepID=UPI002166AE3B|nr:protein PRRC2C isoform X2 [Anthonomus grandis grandis]
MSTLSGNASKGEKTKPKFQSLDINNLYKISRGENTEKPAQKSSSNYIKHGMQSLGKVPNARRAPANLPSLKSEHSDSGAAVPLVPPGATGWGKQEQGGTPSSNIQQNGTPPNHQGVPPHVQGPPQLTPHQQAIAIPSTNVIPPHNKQTSGPVASAASTGGDKLWSAVMAAGGHPEGGGGGGHQPPAYQSPQFQHEFPSLSAGDGGGGGAGASRPTPSDYGPGGVNQSGLSLRPQTEGSWTQGGQRAPDGSMRGGSAPPGGPPLLTGPVGRPPSSVEILPPQVRGVLPPFMYKGSFPQGGPQHTAPGPGNNQTHHHHHPPAPLGAPRRTDNRPPRLQDNREFTASGEEVVPRPIIREEELSKLDNFGHDMGWATSDDIDYNQKLAFSDDEDRPAKREPPRQHQQGKSHDRQTPPKHGWNAPRNENRGRQSDNEDDVMVQKQRQHQKEMEVAIQRAKQRKEEEEKRFNEESRQRAQKKLQELDEKVREKRDRDRETEISPSAVPPKPISYVEIPLPDFQKDKEERKEKDNKEMQKQPPRGVQNDNMVKEEPSGFRQLTQIDGKNFSRKPAQKSERDHREQQQQQQQQQQNGPNFSRHFQSDLPPRFMKQQHQQQRGNQQQSQSQQSGQYQHYQQDTGAGGNRWSGNHPPRVPSRGEGRRGGESPERHDDREYKRQTSDESYRSSHHSQSDHLPPQKGGDNRYGDEDKQWQKDKLTDNRYAERKSDHYERERHHEDHRRSQERLISDRFERPQRPDSRDSHTSHTSHTSHGSQGSSNRRSRDSDYGKETSMGSWNEDVEAAYEEKKSNKEKFSSSSSGRVEEKRNIIVPGPITRDRIEAEDINEKRNLTQLKKGETPAQIKKVEPAKQKEEKLVSAEKTSAETIPAQEPPEPKKDPETKLPEAKKPVPPPSHDDAYKDRRNNRGGPPSQSKTSWDTRGSDFHSRAAPPPWGNKRPPSRSHHKPGGRDFYSHNTDSDGSTDTYTVEPKEPKGSKEKDEKLRENKPQEKCEKKQQTDKKEGSGGYVPRGEPSRHGRGGGSNNFRGSRMGGMGKRIDGYGPPPSKSPFGHHEDKDKREDHATDTPSSTLTTATSSADKIKQNQEALAAGIIGKARLDEDKNKPKPPKQQQQQEVSRNKSKGRKDEPDRDSNHESSDNSGKRQSISRSSSQRGGSRMGRDRNQPPPRMGDKRYESQGKKPDPQNLLTSAIADISLKGRGEGEEEQKETGTAAPEVNGDSEGFQEVKSKKSATKERPKGAEEKKGAPPPAAVRADSKDTGKVGEKKPGGPMGKPSVTQMMTAQQIQNIPPLMSTPVNPPPMMTATKSNQYDPRPNRQNNKLAPRFAKQKMQKQMQQQMLGEVGDMSKGSHGVYGVRDSQAMSQAVTCSAWDKPLGSAALRAPPEHEQSPNSAPMLGVSMEGVGLDASAASPGIGASPGSDKTLGKPGGQITDKNLLDGATPPVNTIIFENTNFKSGPVARSSSRNSIPGDKPRSRLEDNGMDNNSGNNMFGKPINDLLQKTDAGKTEAQMQIAAVFKEETDMKLDFLSADLTNLTDDKSTKNLCMTKCITSVSSTAICNADSLNMKIASVKKVWETSEQESEDPNGLSFGAPMDTAFKGTDHQQDDGHHEGFSPGGGQTASTTNVCKVKPTQQVSNATGQTISSVSQQPHSGVVGHPILLGTPLSPPPMAAAAVGVSMGPQAYAANQHLSGFPTGAPAQGVAAAAAGSGQYGISAIPSPPTVLYNSTQQLQSGLYGAFLPTADQAGVLGGQSHARAGGFGQYPGAGAYHGLGQPANSPYNTQSVYLPPAPHPPTPQAPPELYQSMNSFRLSAAGPFGQSQPLSNPTTVLMSSTSNSLMSASVKPSSQPISAIGTKAGGVGQAYQQQSQQQQQVYMAYEPAALQAANYLTGGVMQRGPAGPPVQNNVVPGLQPSSSYYSGSTGGQTGYYQQPGNSSLPSAQLPQHQAGYGLQGNVFGTHNQSHTNTGLQGSFPFLSTPIQVALSAQQYRSAAASLQNPYLKNTGQPMSAGSANVWRSKASATEEPQ